MQVAIAVNFLHQVKHTHTQRTHIYVSNEFLLCSSGVNWTIYILNNVYMCAICDVHCIRSLGPLIFNVHARFADLFLKERTRTGTHTPIIRFARS